MGTPKGEKADLSHLTDEERAIIRRVLEKEEEFKRQECERLA